jgi:hypothetical protein
MIKKIEIDNIIRISNKNPIGKYAESILMRMQPKIYNKYGCLKLRFTGDLKKDADYICRLFWHCGLIVRDKRKLKEGLPVSRGFVLNDAYEIELVKIPAIIFEDDEDYDDRNKKIDEEKKLYEK